MAEIGDEYIQWPGADTFPGEDTTPAYDRYANGNTTVHSHKGWEWVESDNPFQKAAAALAQSTIEASIRRVRTTFGQVFYQKGNASDKPDFPGEAYGDTARIQDPSTLDIVAEWKWNGLDWERARVSGEQISNLDVGRLTAGSAAINDLAARRIAGDIGKFLQLTTDQLTVTGNASFVDLTAKHVWTRIINARQGEFEKIKAGMLDANSVTADNIRAGAVDGQVITGATVQTSSQNERGLKINNDGMQVYAQNGWKALDINAHSGDIIINGRIGRRDTWSEAYFTDIVWASTGSDVGRDGEKIGVGLAFNSLEDDWWDGSIYVSKSSDGTPAIKMASPLRKTRENSKDTPRPYVAVGTQGVNLYTGSENGSSYGTLGLSKYGISMTSGSSFTTISDGGFRYGKNNKNIIASAYDYGWLRSLKQADMDSGSGFYITNEQTAMGWRSHGVWVNNSGVHMTGTKKFTMRVPGVTENTGMWLSHSCTESPFDGIEYWETLTVGPDGKATWTLPEYVPAIASKNAPWVVLTSSGRGRLEKTGYGADVAPWVVHVEGTPGEEVSVLVKGARIIDTTSDDGAVTWVDYALRSPWELGPQTMSDVNTNSPSYTMGGGIYGPTKPESATEGDPLGAQQQN